MISFTLFGWFIFSLFIALVTGKSESHILFLLKDTRKKGCCTCVNFASLCAFRSVSPHTGHIEARLSCRGLDPSGLLFIVFSYYCNCNNFVRLISITQTLIIWALWSHYPNLIYQRHRSLNVLQDFSYAFFMYVFPSYLTRNRDLLYSENSSG